MKGDRRKIEIIMARKGKRVKTLEYQSQLCRTSSEDTMCSHTRLENWPENLVWISQRLYRILKEEIQMERMKVEDMVSTIKYTISMLGGLNT